MLEVVIPAELVATHLIEYPFNGLTQHDAVKCGVALPVNTEADKAVLYQVVALADNACQVYSTAAISELTDTLNGALAVDAVITLTGLPLTMLNDGGQVKVGSAVTAAAYNSDFGIRHTELPRTILTPSLLTYN